MNVTFRDSSTLVIDANIAVWAVLPIVASSGMDTLGRIEGWKQEGLRLVAPSLWLPECTSAIRHSVYATLISMDAARTAMSDLFALGVEVIPIGEESCRSALDWAARLGQARAYDGFYMAMAEALGAEFWTADKRLVNGAKQAGVSWVRWIGEN